MNITLICVGKLKEKYWQDAVLEYTKRISRYFKINIIEVLDEKTPDNLNDGVVKTIKKKEGERILKHISEKDFLICLDIKGKKYSSETFSETFSDILNKSVSNMVFVIGGSVGINDDILKRADLRLSFSDMTFPHQLMRVILLEQIYRGIKIMKNEPYHK